MRSTSVQHAGVTNSAHDVLGGAGANKSKAHNAHELVRTQNQAVVKIVKTAELTYSRMCIQADPAPSASCCCTTGSQSIPYQRDSICTCMRCRACGYSSLPSPSTGVRPRPSRRSKEALVSGTSGSFPFHTLRQTHDKVVPEGKGRGKRLCRATADPLQMRHRGKTTIGWSGRSCMGDALTADLSNAERVTTGRDERHLNAT